MSCMRGENGLPLPRGNEGEDSPLPSRQAVRLCERRGEAVRREGEHSSSARSSSCSVMPKPLWLLPLPPPRSGEKGVVPHPGALGQLGFGGGMLVPLADIKLLAIAEEPRVKELGEFECTESRGDGLGDARAMRAAAPEASALFLSMASA